MNAEVKRLLAEKQILQNALDIASAHYEAAEATAERERERAERAETRLKDIEPALEIVTGDFKELCVTAENRQARIEALEGCLRELRECLHQLGGIQGWDWKYMDKRPKTEVCQAQAMQAIMRADALLAPAPCGPVESSAPSGEEEKR